MTKVLAAFMGALAWCCSSAGGSGGIDTTPSVGSPRIDNGQTGSPSYGCFANECSALAEQTRDSLTKSIATPVFVGSSCEGPTRVWTSNHCNCQPSSGDTYVLKSGDEVGQCLERGRGGWCVLESSEFPGCSPADAGSCQASCALLQKRLEQDAAKPRDAQVRFSQCVTRGDYAVPRCGFVMVIDNQCYTNNLVAYAIESGPFDCALSNEQLLFPNGDGHLGGAGGAGPIALPSSGSGGS